MDPKTTKDAVLTKIIDEIRATKPRGRWYARLVATLKVALIALFLFCAAFALSLFLYDVTEKIAILQFTKSSVIENSAFFLIEFLFIAALGIAGIYRLYRLSDWPLVKDKTALFFGSVFLVAGLGLGLLMIAGSASSPFGNKLGGLIQNVIEIIPGRAAIEDLMESNLGFNKYYVGTITEVRSDGNDAIITVQGRGEKKVFILNDDAENYNKDERVIVEYAGEGDGVYDKADAVKKI